MAKITETAPVAAAAAAGVAAPAAIKKNNFGAYASTSRANALAADIVSLGPPGEGKSIFAASGSEFWPGQEEIVRRYKESKRWTLTGADSAARPRFEPIVLEDMAWLAADSAPVAGLNEMGIVVPTVLDLQAFMFDVGPLKALFQMGEFLNDLLPKKIKFLVFDTVSNFDKVLVPACFAKFENDPAKTVQIWTEVGRAHTRLRGDLKTAAGRRGGNIHTLMHGKASGDAKELPDSNKWKEMAVLAQEAQGKEPISGDVTGKSANLYKGHSNFMFVIKRVDPRPKSPAEEIKDPSVPTWWAHTQVGDWETKSRFMALIRDKEPADLKAIFARIQSMLGDDAGAEL